MTTERNPGERRWPLRKWWAATLIVVALVGFVVVIFTVESDRVGPPPPYADTGADSTPSISVAPSSPRTVGTGQPSPQSELNLVRPDWLGTRVLQAGPSGFAAAQPTPPELLERALPPRPFLPDPTSEEFSATIAAIPDEVIARSTYQDGCPVHRDDLRYVVMHFWGFDERAHRGEMIVHADVAQDVVAVFETLYEARFPIEEMRVYSQADREAPRTGDLNVTSAYACRPVATTQNIWSQHAYGLAIDINPFQNPYQKDDLVVPELATSYLDRTWDRPGMIHPGDQVVAAFESIGWHWGGYWSRPWDLHHFSRDNL